MNLPEIFLSPDTLKRAFIDGLERQLKEDSLGTFILVLANAIFDEKIFEQLKSPLKEKFRLLHQQYAEKLRNGKPINDAPDDVLVFLKLVAMGFNHLGITEYSRRGPWELQYNQFRSLRPSRVSSIEITTLTQRFNEQGFHFNKPFLAKEVFWSGRIEGLEIRLLYNKFPFASMHGLLVPEPEKKQPQFLHADMHDFISRLCTKIAANIPGIAIAYNAYGAGASINHLHFQTFTRQSPLPVCDKRWKHNGGHLNYPVACKIFSNNDDAWQYIAELHHQSTPYNLLYLPDRIFCMPRRFQGSFDLPDWTENFAWYELCGGMTTFNKEDFQKLNDREVSDALLKLKQPDCS